MRGRKRGQRRLQDTTHASPTPRMCPAQPTSPLRGFVPSCETSYDSIPRNRASGPMPCPVFMAGTDIPGPQPFCSIIMTFTRASGLGCLIVRRWRGGNMPSLGPAKRPTPSAMAFPLSRPSASIRGSPLPPPQCPRALRPKPGLRGSPRHPPGLSPLPLPDIPVSHPKPGVAPSGMSQLLMSRHVSPLPSHATVPSRNTNGVLPQSPGLRGSPRYPGCVSENRNNRNAVVPKHRTRRCPPQGGLRC